MMFGGLGPFLASDGLGTTGKRFLGPVSPPVQLTRGRGTQIGSLWGHFWVLWASVAFDLVLRVGVYTSFLLSKSFGSRWPVNKWTCGEDISVGVFMNGESGVFDRFDYCVELVTARCTWYLRKEGAVWGDAT